VTHQSLILQREHGPRRATRDYFLGELGGGEEEGGIIIIILCVLLIGLLAFLALRVWVGVGLGFLRLGYNLRLGVFIWRVREEEGGDVARSLEGRRLLQYFSSVVSLVTEV
jgi:hypothetical protein